MLENGKKYEENKQTNRIEQRYTCFENANEIQPKKKKIRFKCLFNKLVRRMHLKIEVKGNEEYAAL